MPTLYFFTQYIIFSNPSQGGERADFTTTSWHPVRGSKFTIAWSGTSDAGSINSTLNDADNSGDEFAVVQNIASMFSLIFISISLKWTDNHTSWWYNWRSYFRVVTVIFYTQWYIFHKPIRGLKQSSYERPNIY